MKMQIKKKKPLVRVSLIFPFCSYTKPKGQLPDYTSPVVLPDGRTSVEDFCLKIHKNLIKELK